ncbi:MAG: hypothetical protein SVR08_13160, partial [Spirochaetota bacterium]|nr:hypothetical protein [Spirochaetota bacterium]
GLYASDSFEAPLAPGGVKQALQESNSITLQYKGMSREDITNFYRDRFKDESELNWKELKDFTLINDWGSRDWHKIIIIPENSKGVKVKIKGDSWTWIIGTLVIRFFGVLIVLVVLWFALNISGKILSRVLDSVGEN